MAYIPYPERPQAPNTFQTIGSALVQGGNLMDDYSERQQKMRMSMEEMTQKRAAAILAQQEAEIRSKQLEQDTRLKAEADQRAHDFAIEAAKGKVISPTLAKDPSLSRRTPAPAAPSVPGGPSAAELADLSNVQGMNLPAQSVKAGGDATAMMGEALDNQPTEAGDGRVPYDRQGLADLALSTRQIDAKDYMTATKPDPNDKKHNPALIAEYYGKFLPAVAPLLMRLKKDPTVVSDIAYMGEQQGLGQLEEYQKFIDNLKGGNQFNQMGMDRFNLAKSGQQFQQLESLAKRMESDPSFKSIQRREIFEQTAKTAYDNYLTAPAETKKEARRQADQQLLFSLAKIRDEGVVMPGEFDRETKGQGWIQEKINALTSGVEGGLKLSDEQRNYIIKLMGNFRKNAVEVARPRYKYYHDLGEKYGDSDFVTGTWDTYFQGDPQPGSEGGGTVPAPAAAPASRTPKVEKRAEAMRQKYNY